MFGLGGAWCPVELYAHSTHWFPFTHHGHIKTGDGHQTREQGRGKPWHEVKLSPSPGTGYTGRKVCPSSRRTCTQLALPPSSSCQHLPCPTPSFSLFHTLNSKQKKPDLRQNTTHTTSTRVTNSTIGWILTTWDFLKSNQLLSIILTK